MKDKELRQDVIDELDFEPSIDSADIGVAVEDGVVTLTGHVPSYFQKHEAEKAVRRVKGVRGIAEKLQVRLTADVYNDTDIARRAADRLDGNVLIPRGRVEVKVEGGWLTLSGEVDWNFQRDAADHDLRQLRGVMGVTNLVSVRPKATSTDVTRRIQDALKRSAEVEANAIKVSVQDGKVKLEGKVDSFHDRQVAERAAWSAPGVHAVDDHVHVGW